MSILRILRKGDKKETFGGEIAKQLPVKDIYNDLAHPALSTVGQGLQGVTKLALAPISALVWGYDKIADYLDVAIPEYFEKRKIEKEKIISPDPMIAVPVVEDSRFFRNGCQQSFCICPREYRFLNSGSMIERAGKVRLHPKPIFSCFSSFVITAHGSLSPTFVPAPPVGVAVKLPSAFALFEWFPTILREPLSASDTLSEATAPVKLPT